MPPRSATCRGRAQHLSRRVEMRKGTCSVEGCERLVKARGWCDMHYQRWYKTGEHGDALPLKGRPVGACLVEGCDRAADRAHGGTRGICGMHYARWRKHGDLLYVRPRQEPVCVVDDCMKASYLRGQCGMHYARWQRRGSMELPQRGRQSDLPCSIDGCEKMASCRGWCFEVGSEDDLRTEEATTANACISSPRRWQHHRDACLSKR